MLALRFALLLALIGPAAAADLPEAAERITRQTNEFRSTQGLEAVAINRELEAAAEAFARYMARTGITSHTADGRQPVERATAEGYDHCIVSENLARVYRSSGYDAAALAHDMVEGWKSSPGHRKNMLDPAVTETGAGIAQDRKGRYFGVQMFGRPKSEAIRFSVRNESARKVEYRMGERAFSLAPRAERTHSVCRPLELSIALSKPFSAPARSGARYVVIERGGGLAVKSESD